MEEKCKGLKVKLKVEARDKHGKLIDTREKEADLILDNFRDILAELLYPRTTLTANSARYAALVDHGGTARSVAILSTLNITDGQAINFIAADNVDLDIGVQIAIGTSTVTPTRGDYKLGAEVTRNTPTVTVGADYISWAVSIVLETAANIAEAGLVIRCIHTGYAATFGVGFIFLFRDTFTVVSVPAGGTISITYTLTL